MQLWIQGRVVASSANLRALFVGADDAAHVLLAEHRLAQLGIAFTSPHAGGADGGGTPGATSLAGAVVGVVSKFSGAMALRRVVGVESLVLGHGGEAPPGGGPLWRHGGPLHQVFHLY